MPELPEVETIVNDLAPQAEGRGFQEVLVQWPGAVGKQAPEELAAGLAGQRVLRVSRRGKYILFRLSSGQTLIFHLGMTGRLCVPGPDEPPDPYCRATFHLDEGRELRFGDVRKFGRIWLVDDAACVVGTLGPDALDPCLGPEGLIERLERRPGARIKALLLDQAFLAGLGNIYADEALYEARIHPARRAATLPEDRVRELHEAIRVVLQRSIRNRGTSFSDYRDGLGRKGNNQEALLVFRRAGDPCPRCGTIIRRIVVAGRGTYFCPTCQQP